MCPKQTRPNQVFAARSRLGVATRLGRDADAEEARRDLAAARIEREIRRSLSVAPTLREDQRARLAALLEGESR